VSFAVFFVCFSGERGWKGDIEGEGEMRVGMDVGSDEGMFC
jgi:hypothetical protein